MKKKSAILPLAFAGFVSIATNTSAQAPFTTKAFLDINNIKANHQVHGNLWFNQNPYGASCEFPKGSGKHINSASGIWLSGNSAQNNLHISALTFGISGNDFWPGPLETSFPISYNTSKDWARIWKINRADLEDFVDLPSHTIANTKKDILEWPAKGNPYAKGNNNATLNITRDMAPFVDEDGDGNYNALKGDYPLIKGDQMLWWVMNDNGPEHGGSNGTPLQVEIKVMAYAYTGAKVNNALFYEYELTNKSGNAYDNFRFGLFSNADLGNPHDDFTGFDSSRRMAILYNGKQQDGNGESFAYDYHVPMSGITFLQTPGDAAGYYAPMGSFVNINFGENLNDATAYDNLLRSKHSNGDVITVSCGADSGKTVPYIFDGDLKDQSGWTECNCGNPPSDRIFVMATNDYHFAAGATAKYAFALLATDTLSNLSCGGSFGKLQALADYASEGYHLSNPTAVNELVKGPVSLKVYPNPATQQLFVEKDGQNLHDATIIIYDGLGRALQLPMNAADNKMEIDISSLPNGVYTLLYRYDGRTSSNVFVKQ